MTETRGDSGALHMLNRNHQQRKKKMDCKLKLGQLVDRHFDALSAKYERVETSKLLTSGITMIAGGNINFTFAMVVLTMYKRS